ncbi:MAG: hypothetical protein JJ920_08930 [Roseitalea sp.]|nr:hypothetical protein [Roseitalea sp.]MBO6722863.1 hypothetical protein [Roseitalea sp.]MBO6743022.1 hypothetical protein [Roseitalea sp.]
MDSLQNALRKALAKGDAHDPAFRQRVYEAAASAMQRSLTARGEATPDKLAAQTQRLGEAIEAIEQDVRAQADAPAPSPDIPPPHAPDVPPVAANPDNEAASDIPAVETPAASAGSDAGLYVEPRLETARAEAEAVRAETEPRVRRSPLRVDRGPFATGFAVIVAAALVFGGLWWIITSGAFVSEEARDTSVPNPPRELGDDDFAGRDAQSGSAPRTTGQQDEGEWVMLFTPADPAALSLEGGATASMETDPFGDYARLVTPADTGRVYIDVPVGTLQMLAGSRVQVSLSARADDGRPTQMSVTCDFGPLGDCGRRRFDVGQSATEFLFHVDLPDGAAPSEPGFLILRTDIEADGRAINLLSARVRAEPG